MQRQAQISLESPAGLLLLNSGNRAVYANAEAMRVLAYPENPEKIKPSGSHLTERIRAALLNGKSTNQLPAASEFVSGRRHYACRFFVLESDSKNPAALTLAILMDRVDQLWFLVSSVAQQFHLTCREKEAVKHLSEGLTSKEIATRMGISPNTVKAFLRLVMVKMGVSTRSAILGKIVQH